MNATDIELIVFDLGGVLLELGDGPVPRAWLPAGSQFSLADWLASDTARAFEKGLTDAHTFAETLRADLNIQASAEDIIQRFTDWPTGLFAGCDAMLRRIDKRFRLAVLSNSNELHWPRITGEFGIGRYFEQIFASHRLGMAKPEPEIFQHVIDEMGVEPGKILFFDDNPANVEASRRHGIRGVHVQGIEQTHRALREAGALGAGETRETGSE